MRDRFRGEASALDSDVTPFHAITYPETHFPLAPRISRLAPLFRPSSAPSSHSPFSRHFINFQCYLRR